MKRASEHAKAIRKLHLTLLRRYGRPRIPAVREPIDELMYAVLSRWAPEGRAMAAVERLRRASIDLNDLRVTPVVEIVATLGDDFPRARETAEALYRVLNGVFNRRYTLDLSFLKSMGKRDRERMISGVTGIDPHDAGMFLLRCFRGRHVPVSPDAYAFLRHAGLVDRDASAADIRAFLAKVIPASQAEVFACLLKRHVAANPPPAELPAASPTVVAATPLPPAVATSKKAAPEAVRPKSGANSDKPHAAAAKTSPKQPAPKPANSGARSNGKAKLPASGNRPKPGAARTSSKRRSGSRATRLGQGRNGREKRRRSRPGSRR